MVVNWFGNTQLTTIKDYTKYTMTRPDTDETVIREQMITIKSFKYFGIW